MNTTIARVTMSVVIFVILGLTSAGSVQAADQALAERPNIIFILADDLGFNQIGAYGDTPTFSWKLPVGVN